ncbi:MAG TPA: PVC-type heme-binding CxxCH protein, partial [Verrucomicrobiae bacterium]
MSRFQKGCLILSLVVAKICPTVAAPKPAADPFAEFIRSTPPRTPEEERAGFRLPPGFEIQLFASEPEIGKPMNMAFDGRGRLWISQSREYPFPAKPGKKGRDEVRVLEDTDGDGHADKVTTFADGLNIPIGLYPYKNGVISLSLPNISFHQDTDGDGRADKTNFIIGPVSFDRDTHGLVASFRRGFDGWLYATHGFNNNTTLKARDGSTITMNSGNIWRYRPDGERVEQWTHGQVNPFGLMFDPRGNLYSADCHSSPIYQLLHGGYYPSFGKPDDGLGFAPVMMHHSHGSTAIGGIIYYAADNFPPEFRDNIFVGNVMTCRINRDALEPHGSTLIAREAADFLSCDDPWFRPVDMQLGPDGAIYVADFYNRIIGHYEVPLDHPGRDHERGRIWRIYYKGAPPQNRMQDLTKASTADLINELAAPNHTRRLLALDQLSDRVGDSAVPAIRQMLRTSQVAEQKAYGLWVLHRLGVATEADYAPLTHDPSPLVRIHAVNAAAELPSQHRPPAALVLNALADNDAFVRRAAAFGAGQVQDGASIPALLKLRREVPSDDTHLLYVARMALRNAAAQPVVDKPGKIALETLDNLSEQDSRALADVAVAITNSAAGSFLVQHLAKYPEPRDTMTRYLKHAVRYLPVDQVDAVAAMVQKQLKNDLDLQVTMFKSIQDGLSQRGQKLTTLLRQWGAELAGKLLTSVKNQKNPWHPELLPESGKSENPWVAQQRVSKDGDKSSFFLCSLPKGEKLTGKLVSAEFSIPSELKFFLAGHDGFPDKPAQKKNKVQLVTTNGEVVAIAWPPRNDTAQPVHWDFVKLEKEKFIGQKAHLELIDDDNGSAYAWLAAGRFEPKVVSVPESDPSVVSKRQQAAADLARTSDARTLEPEFLRLCSNSSLDVEIRIASARTLLAFEPNEQLLALAEVISDASVSRNLRETFFQLVTQKSSSDPLAQAMREISSRLQLKLAQTLAATPAGADRLLKMVRVKQAPASLLQERTVREKL